MRAARVDASLSFHRYTHAHVHADGPDPVLQVSPVDVHAVLENGSATPMTPQPLTPASTTPPQQP